MGKPFLCVPGIKRYSFAWSAFLATTVLLSLLVSPFHQAIALDVNERREAKLPRSSIHLGYDTKDNKQHTHSTGCGLQPPVEPGQSAIFSMLVDDVERGYILHVPLSYNRTFATPLVFDFHGYFDDANHEEKEDRFSTLGDTENFITVVRKIRTWETLSHRPSSEHKSAYSIQMEVTIGRGSGTTDGMPAAPHNHLDRWV